jgi:hypothetical protein
VRLSLVLLYSLVLGVGCLFLWRAAALNGLPDVGTPVDVRALERIRVPDDQNAAPLYARAGGTLTMPPGILYQDYLNIVGGGWEGVPSSHRDWLSRNHEALLLWREATDRPDADFGLDLRPTAGKQEFVFEHQRALALLGLLEVARCEADRDWDGAWTGYRAVLRASRHVGMHAGLEGRILGSEMHAAAAVLIRNAVTSPDIDAGQLQRALEDVQALDAMTPPITRALQYEYARLVFQLRDIERWVPPPETPPVDAPPTLPHEPEIRRFLRNEPERSRRVLKLVFANWLAQCDRPPADRPPSTTSKPELFADPKAPPAARAVTPQALQDWYASAELARLPFPNFAGVDTLHQERNTQASLIVYLAEQWYLRDHKKMPDSVDDLIGLYLRAVPPGYESEVR